VQGVRKEVKITSKLPLTNLMLFKGGFRRVILVYGFSSGSEKISLIHLLKGTVILMSERLVCRIGGKLIT